MEVIVHQPCRALAEYVDCIWQQAGAPPLHARERIVPSATTEIIIALRDVPLTSFAPGGGVSSIRNGALCGPQARYLEIDTVAQGALVGVHFRPAGAFAVLGGAMSEVRGLLVGLDDVFGAGVRRLRDRLRGAPNTSTRFALLESWLLERLSRAPTLHPVIAHAARALDIAPQPIAALVRQSGWSPRRFIGLFEAQAGLTPKLFARVRRLQHVLSRIEAAGSDAWIERALAAGYFDQSHLIRDFRELAGVSPTEYLARRHSEPNHLICPA